MMRRRAWVVILVAAVIAVTLAGVYIGMTLTPPVSTSPPPPPPPPPPEQSDCPRSSGLCIEREVTRVIDGDTLDVQGGLRIRLVLVDAPELSESDGPAARDFLTDLCLGSLALIDEDDFQIGDDPYGRILAVVYCDGTNANAGMISSGHADTYSRFCSESEFESEVWTGCSSPRRHRTWIAGTSRTGISGFPLPTRITLMGTGMGSGARAEPEGYETRPIEAPQRPAGRDGAGPPSLRAALPGSLGDVSLRFGRGPPGRPLFLPKSAKKGNRTPKIPGTENRDATFISGRTFGTWEG